MKLIPSTNDFDVSMFQGNMLEYQQGRDEVLQWLPRTGEKPVVNQELLSQMDALAGLWGLGH